MHRRRFIEIIAAGGLVGCASPQRDLPASPDFIVENVGERLITALPRSPMFWRIENLPTLAEAQAASQPTSLVAEVSGRVWLATLGAQGERTPGAAFVAEIGPVPRVEADRYTLRLNHAHAPPGAATSVHTHPGSEAFYVLAGQLSQRTPHGTARVNAGETLNGHMPGMVMQLQSTGTEPLDQLVLFVVDAGQAFSSPASFHH
jgi:mannose-6-phosphate isomerase-like protein (cupin superfamily)